MAKMIRLRIALVIAADLPASYDEIMIDRDCQVLGGGSAKDWFAPEHVSVGAASVTNLGGCNAFRALLTARLRFSQDAVELGLKRMSGEPHVSTS
jgi:hypothetical protein